MSQSALSVPGEILAEDIVMYRQPRVNAVRLVASLLAVSGAAAQPGPPPDPVVKTGAQHGTGTGR